MMHIPPPSLPYLLLTHLSRVATANILLHSPRVNLHNKNQYTLGRIFASLPLTPTPDEKRISQSRPGNKTLSSFR